MSLFQKKRQKGHISALFCDNAPQNSTFSTEKNKFFLKVGGAASGYRIEKISPSFLLSF